MTFAPLAEAGIAVQLHVAGAVLAVLIGPFALYRRRRDRAHRMLGRVWIGVMLLLAFGSFLIPSTTLALIGPFGPIHIISAMVLWWLWQGVTAICRGDVKTHQLTMRALYWQSLGIAGTLSFMPGRTLNAVVFPDQPGLGWVVLGLGAMLFAIGFIRSQRQWAGQA